MKPKGDKALKTEKAKKEETVNKVQKSGENSVNRKRDENKTKGDKALKTEKTKREKKLSTKLKRVMKIV